MPKVTLDMSTFKALASDTRLQILRTLDGKKMNLQEISRVTKLNKATLHEHLQKLHEAGLVKKNEREGHKWVYYKLSWKGEGLLHPENTRIVVMFTATFIALAVGIIQFIQYVKGYIVAKAVNLPGSKSMILYPDSIRTNSAVAVKDSINQTVVVNGVNQTYNKLTEALLKNFNIKGVISNKISSNDIYWNIQTLNKNCRTVTTEASDKINTNDTSSIMFAVVHDPAFQWIGITCIIISVILLTISIWRYQKNKVPKL